MKGPQVPPVRLAPRATKGIQALRVPPALPAQRARQALPGLRDRRELGGRQGPKAGQELLSNSGATSVVLGKSVLAGGRRSGAAGRLLRLPWSAHDGARIRLRQSKGGAGVVIPVGAPLKAALDGATKHSTVILTGSDERPWTADRFRSSWRKACATAGVVTFHDLRGTAVTRLALVGCTEAEIATITGLDPAGRIRPQSVPGRLRALLPA